MSNCTEIQYLPGQFYNGGLDNIRGECSGQGSCIASLGACVCNEGWTGNSDFFGDPGTDCQIFVLGIQIEYGLLLALCLLSWYKQFPGWKKRLHDFTVARDQALGKGKTYKVYQNRALLTMIIWNGLGATSMIITCILRMAVPEERIGVTPTITTFFMITKNSLYFCSFLYQPYLFKTLLKGDVISESSRVVLLHFVNIASIIGLLLSAAGSFVPYISVGNPELAVETFSVYYLLSAFGLFYNAAIAVAIYNKAEKLFGASYSVNKNENVLATKNKMKGFQKTVAVNATIFGMFYLIFFLWPFWWGLHDYYHAVTWLAFIKFANDISLGTLERKSTSGGKNLSTVDGNMSSDKEPEGHSMSV